MKITIFNDVFGTTARTVDITWPELYAQIQQPIRYPSKSDIPLIKLSEIGDNRTPRGSLRHDDNITAIHGIECDYDAGVIPLNMACAMLTTAGIYAALYTTPSHTSDKPRWRVLAPTSRILAPHERRELVGKINAALGGALAPESFTLSQTYYFGAANGSDYQYTHSEGHYVDLVQISPVYPVATGPTQNNDIQPAAVVLDQQTIDDITDALRWINSDDRVIWVAVGQDLVGLGDVGYQLWDTWSRSSPKYDEVDQIKRWSTFSGQRADYRGVFAKAARLGWVNPIRERAQDLTGISFDQPHFSFDAKLDTYGAPHWDDKRKKRLNTVENLEWMLSQYGITCYYDEMLKEQFVTYPNGHDILNDLSSNGKLSRIRSLLALNEIPIETSAHLSELLMRRTVNPIMQWIESNPWDGNDRLPTVYNSVHVDSENIGYRNLAMLTWFIQCVAAADGARRSPRKDRIEKYESVLIFQGAQGIHKTSWVQSLAPVEYRSYIKDGVTLDVSMPDSKKAAISAWICELGELDATFRRSDISRLKAFLSSPVDELRLPYDRTHSKFQRRTSFFSTVNDKEFLVDKTGNRRYLPLPVISANPLSDSDIDKQQLWAQVFHYYIHGAQWWPDETLNRMLTTQHDEHSQLDHIEELLLDKFDLTGPGEHSFTCSEIAKELGVNANKMELNGIGRALRKRGHVSQRSTHGRRVFKLSLRNPFV